MKITPLLLTLICALYSFNSFGQNADNNSSECKCNLAFADLLSKLESNYIGLKHLQISGKDQEYEDRKRDYQQKSEEIEPENCTEFLNDFLDYFDDGHLSAFERPKFSEAELIDFKKNIKDTKVSKEQLQQKALEQQEKKQSLDKDIIVGNWTDGQSQFSIIKVEHNYHAYILETQQEGTEAGELKAIFRPTEEGYSCKYYSYKYSPIYLKGGVYKDGQLLVAGHVFWERVASSFSIATNGVDDLKLPSIEAINESSTLLTIPSFLVDYKIFNDFIKENEELIKNSSNLIINILTHRSKDF